MAQAQLVHQVVARLRRLAQRQEAGNFLGDLRGNLRGNLRGGFPGEPWCRAEGNHDRTTLLLPDRGGIDVVPAPVDDLQRARAPLLDDSGAVEHIGDGRLPGPRLVRLGQLLRREVEV